MDYSHTNLKDLINKVLDRDTKVITIDQFMSATETDLYKLEIIGYSLYDLHKILPETKDYIFVVRDTYGKQSYR